MSGVSTTLLILIYRIKALAKQKASGPERDQHGVLSNLIVILEQSIISLLIYACKCNT